MISVINSWKNKKVFEKQLELNLSELNDFLSIKLVIDSTQLYNLL